MENQENLDFMKQIVEQSQSMSSPTIGIVSVIIIFGIVLLLVVAFIKLMKVDAEQVIVDKVYKQMHDEMGFIVESKRRYSVREFDETEIDDRTLAEILEGGRISPTAKNMQPQRVFVMRSSESKELINKCCNTYNAPLVILVCADKNQCWVNSKSGKDSAYIDATIVTTQMMNTANSLGLGSVWICAFDEEMIVKEFGLKQGVVPVNVLAIGKHKEKIDKSDRFSSERKRLSETVKII